jgi:hypothetical protein
MQTDHPSANLPVLPMRGRAAVVSDDQLDVPANFLASVDHAS